MDNNYLSNKCYAHLMADNLCWIGYFVAIKISWSNECLSDKRNHKPWLLLLFFLFHLLKKKRMCNEQVWNEVQAIKWGIWIFINWEIKVIIKWIERTNKKMFCFSFLNISMFNRWMVSASLSSQTKWKFHQRQWALSTESSRKVDRKLEMSWK